MGKVNYRCAKCQKTFSRKSNAERHNTDIHNEMASIHIIKNDLVSNKRKIYNTAASTGGALTTQTIATENSSSVYNNNNKTMAEERPQIPNFNFKDLAHNNEDNLNLDTDVNNHLDKFLKIFEKLMPLVDELDKILRDIKENMERIKILSDTIIKSLMSPNPFKYLKETIKNYRIEAGFVKASGFIALSENISLQKAKIKLKTLAWNSPYIKTNLENAIY
jgi:hypothetical protein